MVRVDKWKFPQFQIYSNIHYTVICNDGKCFVKLVKLVEQLGELQPPLKLVNILRISTPKVDWYYLR